MRFEPILEEPWDVEQYEPLILPRGLGREPRPVLVDGHWSDAHARLVDVPEGVFVGTVRRDAHLDPEIGSRLGMLVASTDVWSTVNTALLTDVLVVWVRAGTRLRTPIHVVHASRHHLHRTATQPRTVVLVETGAHATLVEHHVGCGHGNYLSNSVSELFVADEARLTHVRVVEEDPDAIHGATTWIAAGEASRVRTRVVWLGGTLAREGAFVRSKGDRTRLRLEGTTGELPKRTKHLRRSTPPPMPAAGSIAEAG